MCFLKEACKKIIYLVNFCVSGIATQWYYYRKNKKDQIKFYRSFINLFKFHWGSVLGCALLTGGFYILDFILDFLLVHLPVTEEQRHLGPLSREDAILIASLIKGVPLKPRLLRLPKPVPILDHELHKPDLNPILQRCPLLLATEHKQPLLRLQPVHHQGIFLS